VGAATRNLTAVLLARRASVAPARLPLFPSTRPPRDRNDRVGGRDGGRPARARPRARARNSARRRPLELPTRRVGAGTLPALPGQPLAAQEPRAPVRGL